MSKIVDINERSFKEKVEWKIYNAKCRAKNAYHWVKEHPTQTMIIVTTAVGAISEVRRTGDRIAKIATESLNAIISMGELPGTPAKGMKVALTKDYVKKGSNSPTDDVTYEAGTVYYYTGSAWTIYTGQDVAQ